MDIVRVLRVVEYIGPRASVEAQVNKSLSGSNNFSDITINAQTVCSFPEVVGEIKYYEKVEA